VKSYLLDPAGNLAVVVAASPLDEPQHWSEPGLSS
jgi:hypothetical protein